VPDIGLFGSSTGAQKMGQMSNSNAEHTVRSRPDARGVPQMPLSALALGRMQHTDVSV